MNSNSYEVRLFRPGDEERVLAFHNRAFAPARSMAHFEWRFLQNPAGPPQLALALDAERCVGIYASIPVRCIVRGEPVLACVHTDCGVDPDLRRGLSGTRVILAVEHLHKIACVHGRVLLEWGFPEPALQRVVVRHCGVGVLRDVHMLVLAVDRVPVPPDDVDVAPVAAVPSDVDSLWQRVATSMAMTTVRDASYLDWRYARHPDHAHVMLTARSGGVLRGFAVLRDSGPDPSATTIMELIVPPDDGGAERALLARAGAEARARGREHVAAWVPLQLPAAYRWQRDYGFFVASTPFQECYRSWSRDLHRRWLGANWHRSIGDIDFF